MQKKFTPEVITSLAKDEIFVFGSNLAGVHGAGAARLAYQRFGAIWGKGEGLMGLSYALPTKDTDIETRSLEHIGYSVIRLIDCCYANPDKTFLVTKCGCGLAGLRVQDIAPLFKTQSSLPTNLVLPREFHDIIYS